MTPEEMQQNYGNGTAPQISPMAPGISGNPGEMAQNYGTMNPSQNMGMNTNAYQPTGSYGTMNGNQVYGTMNNGAPTYGTMNQGGTYGTTNSGMNYATMGQPYQGMPMAGGPVINGQMEPKKKSKAPLIIGITAGVLLLAGGGATYGILSHNAKVREAERLEQERILREQVQLEEERAAAREAERLAEEQAQKEAEEQAAKEAEAQQLAQGTEEDENEGSGNSSFFADEFAVSWTEFTTYNINNVFGNWGYAAVLPGAFFYADTDGNLYLNNGSNEVTIDNGEIDGLYAYCDDAIIYNKDYAVWKATKDGEIEELIPAQDGWNMWYLVIADETVLVVYKNLDNNCYYISANNDTNDTEIAYPQSVTITGGYIYYVDANYDVVREDVYHVGEYTPEFICESNYPVGLVATDDMVIWASPTEDGYAFNYYDIDSGACDTIGYYAMEVVCLNVLDGYIYASDYDSAAGSSTIWRINIYSGDVESVYETEGQVYTITMVPGFTNFIATTYHGEDGFQTHYVDLP